MTMQKIIPKKLIFVFNFVNAELVNTKYIQWNPLNGITINRFIRLMGSFL